MGSRTGHLSLGWALRQLLRIPSSVHLRLWRRLLLGSSHSGASHVLRSLRPSLAPCQVHRLLAMLDPRCGTRLFTQMRALRCAQSVDLPLERLARSFLRLHAMAL